MSRALMSAQGGQRPSEWTGAVMRLVRLTTAPIAVLAALALPASVLASDPLQWSVAPKAGGQPKGATAYRLSNDRGGVMRYGTQTVGINLVYGGIGTWEFRKIGAASVRDHRTIAATERVALYNRSIGQYLVYGPRFFGVSLMWSATARYEWKVYEAQSNAPSRVKLYNTAKEAYLVNGYQRFGINLEWQSATYTTSPPN